MHDELADAFSQTYQEGSAERMQLALEHLRALRTAVQPPPPQRRPIAFAPEQFTPEQRREAQIADLIDAYADSAHCRHIEQIARVITSRAYRIGFCFVSWAKLARWLKMEEDVLAGHLAEMESEELIRITPREGTSPVIQFADGTLDALRFKMIHGITTRERTHPRVVRTFADSASRH